MSVLLSNHIKLSLFQILPNLIVSYHSVRIGQFESILDVDDFASFPHLLVQDNLKVSSN